ncbi:HlyD family efflux transporter periplasmic adaptor subunit [Hominisplanchenecus murintestinalis]|uniref:HlyD family efflux transporter periplasmic adaptor subunit n=1 Tax=Hominisplanchenecus murintestinalis TaxID=2941517 RepID=A0AC61QY47_9FIRM|nr:HlyD family efflux transporter periplasmic adaptor subunit [Hominisplanchenecus murintestinalis]TGX98013.1 HlyD family efflux transporter periplasmic adaptor subunit [Hominisplanchenecus murintestinalis]
MKRKNKKKKIIIIAGILAAVFITGTGTWYFISRTGKVRAMVPVEAMSTKVQTGNLSTTVVGTGTLKNDTANAVKIPDGITVDEVMVESGDAVKAGEVLAIVNQASVTQILSQIQDELAELDEEINDTKGDKESAYIKTYIAGRVKKIYAETGENASAVMQEKGSLLVLSIDGKMAVSLEGVSGMGVGDDVTVRLSDGSEKEGTVESASEKSSVITLTDNGTSVGEKVTVLDKSGEEIGSGELYIHQPIEITGTAGTISEIVAEENEEVGAGDTLVKLTDLPDSSEYQQLLDKRSELTETLKALAQLSAQGTIQAEYDGTVESVYVTAEETEGNSTDGYSTGASIGNGMVSVQEKAGFVLTAESVQSTPQKEGFTFANTSETEKSTEEAGVTAVTDLMAVFQELGIAAPVKGEIPVSEIEETGQYTGSIRWTPADGIFAAQTAYTAEIELIAKAGYQFMAVDGAEVSFPGAQTTVWEIGEQCEGNTLKLSLAFPETEKEEESETQGSQENPGDIQNPDNQENQGGSQNGQQGTDGGEGNQQNQNSGQQQNSQQNQNGGQGQNDSQNPNSQQNQNGGQGQNDSQNPNSQQNPNSGQGQNSQQSQNGSQGAIRTQTGVSGGSLAGASASAVSTASQASSNGNAEETADSSMVTVFTISKNENVLLSVNIDELDILSIQEGQKAAVTLDALEGQEFEGEITKISRTASNSGGVTKYTAEVTIPKEESMLAGMNASAVITIERKENVLTLSADALQERGNRTFVYTETGEDGMLSGEVEVETGISDGTNVEIVSGLESGQTVYYHRVASENEGEEGFGGMMMNGMPGGGMQNMGGERPDKSGGQPPSGGFGGPGGQRGE